MSTLLLCIVWLSLQQLCAGQTMRCRRNRVISSDATLLAPMQNITAFRDDNIDFHLENIIEVTPSGFVWCENDGTGNYVNMTFSQPVVVEGIISSGATDIDNALIQYFVSNFTILYSKTVDGPLQLYSPQNFIATSRRIQYSFVDSIPALKYQFRINEFQTSTFFCWALRIIGCTLKNAVPDNPQAVCSTTPAAVQASTVQQITTTLSSDIVQRTDTPSASNIPPTTHTVTVTVQPSCDTVAGQQSSQVAGAIGGGTAVLMVGVIMIISAIILCIVTLVIRRKTQSVEVKNNRSTTVLKVENVDLYSTNTINSSADEEGTLTNTLYGDVETDTPEYATVESAHNVVTTPNHCYRAMDHTNNNNTTTESK